MCIFLGDLVDYGLDPSPCIDWVRQHAQLAVRGNHDHGVAQNVVVTGRNGFKYLTGVTRVLTRELIVSTARIVARDMASRFGLARPRLARSSPRSLPPSERKSFR